MLRFTLHRLLLLAPVLIAVSILVFAMMAMVGGDPARVILGAQATDERVEELRRAMALDEPLPAQYFNWIGNALRGDLGRAYSLERPVLDEVRERLGPTLLLAGTAFLICSIAGLAAGAWMAARQGGGGDRVLSVLVAVGISTPSFWLGLVLILAFAVRFPLLPAGGMQSVMPLHHTLDILKHLLLPAMTLGLVATGIVARLMRSQMLDVLRQDFIRTARAKGVPEPRVIRRHAFKNALANMTSVLGVQAGFVIGGAVYVETIFQWPGIGRMLVDAIATRDLLLVQGGVLVVTFCYILVNLLADLAQHALDPRLRETP